MQHFRLLIPILLILFMGLMVTVGYGEENNLILQEETDPEINNIRVDLTPEEEAYLAQLGTVKMCVDPDWMPYEIVHEDGNFEGIAADLIYTITERSGVELELVPTKDWEESLEYSKEGKCHILAFLTQTPARDEWLLFTDPYFSDPVVFITHQEHEFISDPYALDNPIVALPSGTAMEERIRNDYPHFRIVTTGSAEADAFRMIENREADMTVRSLTVAAYVIRDEGWFNLKIAGTVPEYYNEFRIGVCKDEPMLRDILNKGVNTITPQEVQQIVNKHISIEATTESVPDYSLALRIMFVSGLIMLVIVAWTRNINSLNKELKKREEEIIIKEEQFRSLFVFSPISIIVHDKDSGEIIDANPTACNTYGFSSIGDLKKEKKFLSSPYSSSDAVGWIRKAASEGVQQFEWLDRKSTGEEFWVHVYLNKANINGVERIVANIIDITDEKNAENDRLKLEKLERNQVLIHEIHHRVKNNLQVIISLLSMQSNLFKDEHFKAALKENQNRIRSMSLAHEKLYAGDTVASIEISDYVSSLMRHISQMNSSVNVPVDLEVDVDELYLNMDITIPLGMIINEIVTNSFKHAFDGKDKGHISISFKENDDGYELVVKDDGIGIPESLEQMNFNTLGLKVINLLVTQLQGDLRLDNLDGTCYTISIPKEV